MAENIYCPALKKEFNTKEELFKSLKENIDLVIDAKKSEIYKSCDKGVSIPYSKSAKVESVDAEKAIQVDDKHYFIVVNTTNILDSHMDLHVNGIWNKSINEQQYKNCLTTDHSMDIEKIAVVKGNVEMLITNVSFSSLGFPYQGNTQALIYKVPKDKFINRTAKDWLDRGDEIEASVRMQYVTIELAMDSNDPEDATEKKRYDDYFPRIANKSDFIYIPYFFIIKEAKNVRESSLVVAGSNYVTGNIFRKKSAEPSKDTQKNIEEKQIDPTLVSQKLKSSLLLI